MSDAQTNKIYVDQEAALGRMRGNEKLYARMLGLFLKSPEFDEFEQALADGDNEKAADVAHGIKGMTGNLSLTQLFDTSSILMDQLRQGDADSVVLEEYHAGLAETRRQVKKLVEEMQA